MPTRPAPDRVKPHAAPKISASRRSRSALSAGGRSGILWRSTTKRTTEATAEARVVTGLVGLQTLSAIVDHTTDLRHPVPHVICFSARSLQ